jgi:hypothetical protein
MNKKSNAVWFTRLWAGGGNSTTSLAPQRKAPLLLLLSFVLALALGACQPVQPTSQWEAAQTATEGQAVVSEGEVIAGGEFNKFFPDPEDPFDITFLQEKEGFAEAALEFEGDEVATLAVTDTANNPSARDKYAQSSDELEGYPMVAVGNNGTAILVADRIQVQVRSKADDFAAEDREAWLLEFDLDGLAALAD